jgi:hypothetical protein
MALTGAKRLKLAESLANLGVDRFPDIGTMTHFESPWDGTITIERLIRWSTLGGP